ncbi:MAG: c-type cytochrome [Betaproteobacteria bacterium]|nr:c-type cytochrome [Betaproteobacteria bacterium]
MPRHIVRLLLIFAIGGAIALIARILFQDKSYGRYGIYRGDAVAEIAADEPMYQGPGYCQSCHAERHAEWTAGIHKVVVCETCHGAAAKHPSAKAAVTVDLAGKSTRVRIAGERLEHIKLAIPADSVKLCTLCHEKMPGRPAAQKQIEVSSHAGGQQCIVCHNPHSPKIGAAGAQKAGKPGDAAAGRKKAAACAACHGAEGVSGNPEWPSLAGQQRGYLAGALLAYKSGARPDPMMSAQAKGLSEADIGDLAAFYSDASCKAAGSKSSAQLASAGKAKAAACASCHGAEGVSGNPAWPSLAGLQEAYLVNALKAYQSGARRNPMMAGLAKGLSEAEIGQLAAYYAGLKCK